MYLLINFTIFLLELYSSSMGIFAVEKQNFGRKDEGQRYAWFIYFLKKLCKITETGVRILEISFTIFWT